MLHSQRKGKQVSGFDMVGTTTVGERGQVVIPASVRKQARIKPGDKLVVFMHSGMPLCMLPVRAMKGFMSHMVKHFGSLK